MVKYDTWSITCKLCDWQWETCSRIMAHNPKCNQCGSTDCIVEENEIITVKKQGKIITEVGYDPTRDDFGEINDNVWENIPSFSKPLLVIREEDCKFSEDLTNEHRKELLGKMDSLRDKIIRDIIDNVD